MHQISYKIDRIKNNISDEKFSQNFSYNFSEFLYNFITLSHFLYEHFYFEHFSKNLHLFSEFSICAINYEDFPYVQLIMKIRKISKIFCKYNFWWNVIKSKKLKNIFS